MKVLIADDNDASCKLLRALLEADGHAVIVAADGRQALELLERYTVDAIISDNTGLGLSVVDGIVKQHGGYLSVTSRPGLGTTFSIYLPAVEGIAEGLPSKPLSRPVTGNETILLVEDEDPVREVTALLLESLGYEVLQVSNARDALNLVENTRAKIDLLFTDVIMPGMSGRELVEALRMREPGLKVLFQSGYTDDMVIRHGVLRAEVAFLQKPFTVDALAKKIRERLDQE